MKISQMGKWSSLRAKLMAKPGFKEEYDKLSPEFDLISALISARAKSDMTQVQLAKKLGTKQSAIARLESGRGNPSYNLLQKIAKATGTKFQFQYV